MTYDVIVVGGGPGGSTAAAFLARGGLKVAVFEREVFPRFHVGESLMPAVMVLLDQLGVREAVESAGFQVKRAAMFTDEAAGRTQTFYFLDGQPWPNYAYQVPRAEFDTILLENARKQGADVYQPATVESVTFDAEGATVSVNAGGLERRTVRARMLVDASGRDSFLASRIGQRTRRPNLGKVALYAHFRGARRLTGIDEGNLRLFVFDDGWFWWIPLADDITSVGAVLHAKTTRGWHGSLDELFEEMVRRCRSVADGLRGAERVTAIHRSANFAYVNSPVVGDRFLAVGDAITFVDPVFSGGVYIAMHSGRLAAETILEAFATGRFSAARFGGYERAIRRGVAPLFRFIHKYYEPAFFDLLMHPKNVIGTYPAVLAVLSGGSFMRMTWRTRVGLAAFFVFARFNRWALRRTGRSTESRLDW